MWPSWNPEKGRQVEEFVVDVSAFNQQILPDTFQTARVFGYGGLGKSGNGTVYEQQIVTMLLDKCREK